MCIFFVPSPRRHTLQDFGAALAGARLTSAEVRLKSLTASRSLRVWRKHRWLIRITSESQQVASEAKGGLFSIANGCGNSTGRVRGSKKVLACQFTEDTSATLSGSNLQNRLHR